MSETSIIKPENTVPVLDRIIQFRYALLAASLVLAVDAAQVPLRALGFPAFNWFASQSAIPLGTALAFAASYVFYMAALAPAVQMVVEFLLVTMRVTPLLTEILNLNTEPVSYESKYARGKVKVTDAQKDALTRKDDFWIKRVNEHLAQEREKAKDARIVGRLSFACILLVIMDWQWGTAQSSWLHDAAQRINSQAEWMGTSAALLAWLSLGLLALPWFFGHFADFNGGGNDDWIAQPELATQRLKEIEERRKRM
jgi:hypothetical protein